MKNNHREGKKTAVTEDIPTPQTENLRYAGDDWEREDDLSTDPTRPAYAGDDWERVTLDKLRKVNAGTNKSAAAGSTSLNTKRLHEHTENLPHKFNAGTNKSAAAGSTSLNTIEDGPKDKRHKNGERLIADDVIRTEIKCSLHSYDIKESFPNRTGAKISEATVERLKQRRQYIIEAFDRTRQSVFPIKDLDAMLAARMRKCAHLALADFNGQERTNYRFVDLKTVGYQIVNGTKYCIKFGARSNGHYDTFEAEVVRRVFGRLEKKKVRVNIVHIVGMKNRGKNPRSIWRRGTLQELIN